MLLNEVLKNEMLRHNLEIKDLARITGLSYQKIYSYVKGAVPNNKDLNTVCEAMGIDVDDITFDELNISVTECARTMKKANGFVKAMVKRGVFGFYDGSTYHIPRKKFEQYMGMVESIDMNQLVTALNYALDIFITKKADFDKKSAQTN